MPAKIAVSRLPVSCDWMAAAGAWTEVSAMAGCRHPLAAMLSALTSKTFEGMEKLVDLNISTAKAAIENSSATTRQLLGAKDAQEFFALSASQAQPNAEKPLSYGRQLATIASDTGAEF